MRKITTGDRVRASDLAGMRRELAATALRGPGVTRTGSGTIAARAARAVRLYDGPFATYLMGTTDSPAGRRGLHVGRGWLSAGNADYHVASAGIDFFPTEDIDGNAVADATWYALCWRICAHPEGGGFTGDYIPNLCLQNLGSDGTIGPVVEGTHPVEYVWTLPSPSQSYWIPCVFEELGRFYAETTTRYLRWRQTLQGQSIRVPVWHYYQTGDATRPVDWYVTGWEFPANDLYVDLLVPKDATP